MEKTYQGEPTAHMLADYCWTIVHDNCTYKRKVKKFKTN